MFACWVCFVFTYEYPTIWVNTNPTCLLNKSRFIDSNTTHLLNGSVFIKFYQNEKKNNNTNQIDMNYEKNYYYFNINSKLMSNCITNIRSKLKRISISQIINHKMSKKINYNN